MRRSAFAALLGAALLVGLATLGGGCRPRESAVERGAREQVLHRGFSPDIADLDPHVAMMVSDVISNGPKASAKRAITGANATSAISPRMPPTKMAHTPVANALTGCHFWASG
jgi:hypothetical protein